MSAFSRSVHMLAPLRRSLSERLLVGTLRPSLRCRIGTRGIKNTSRAATALAQARLEEEDDERYVAPIRRKPRTPPTPPAKRHSSDDLVDQNAIPKFDPKKIKEMIKSVGDLKSPHSWTKAHVRELYQEPP